MMCRQYCAALHAWKTGKDRHKDERFEGDLFNSTFERHMEYLQSMKKDNVTAFHVILSRLYDYATYVFIAL